MESGSEAMAAAARRGKGTSGPQQLKEGSGVMRVADSMCAPQYAASLKCLEDFNFDKSKCKDKFDAYKECRKSEKEQRLELNKSRKWFG